MDVVTFGETMVALNPLRPGSLDHVTQFQRAVAGAESNVAIGLARLGHDVTWLSRLGNDSFGRLVYKTLRGEGVDVSGVQFDDHRPTGVYFKELLANGRANAYYYRSNSAASQLGVRDVSLDKWIGAKYLFVTGITPALSESCRELVFQSIQQAHALGLEVVFDPNIRFKLWNKTDAAHVLNDIASLADIVLPGLEEGQFLTGSQDVEAMARQFLRGKTKQVVVKLGAAGAYYLTEEKSGYVDGFPVPVVDEVGAGDAFTAGIVSGLLDELPIEQSVRRACALGALAVTGVGDYESLPYRSDLERFLQGLQVPSR